MDDFREIKELGLTVSSDGRYVANTDDGFRFSIQTTKAGYHQIQKTINGKRKTFMVHRLVALAYLGKPDCDSLEVNHIDGDKDNNHFSNLEWTTRLLNMQHAHAMGKIPGHQRTELQDYRARMVPILFATGKFTPKELAVAFNVTTACMHGIIKRNCK